LSVKEKMRESVARLYLRRRRNSRKKELSVGFTGGTNEGRMSWGKMIYGNKKRKSFWSNRNQFTVDHYFRPYQTPKNAEIIFQKSFYAETNGAKEKT
jgi:hypothetical protein